MKSKKEKAIAERQSAKESAKVYEISDSLSNAIETFEKNHNIDTSDAKVICTIPVPNLLKNWFSHGHAIAFIPNKFRESNGKKRNLSNLENEIDSACREIKSAYNRKVVFTWNVKTEESEKITSEDVVRAYFNGENPTLKIHFLYTEYKGKRYGFSDGEDKEPETVEINKDFSF